MPVLVAVTALTTFSTALLPGDPARAILGRGATATQLDAVRRSLGLDQPLPVRYWHWLVHAAHGNLGTSYVTGEPVGAAIVNRLPVTAELMLLSQLLALAVALPLALIVAVSERRLVDQSASAVAFGLLSVPSFVFGIVLIFVFAVEVHWLPATGFVPLGDGLLANLRAMILPSVALAAGSVAVYYRVLRAGLERTLHEDFMLVARAKGLSTRALVLRHALRPSSLPLVTVVGLNVASLMGGAVLIEVLFALPGLGRLLVDAISERDYIMIQGITAFIAVTYIVVNTLVDLAYGLLDPRLRHAR